MDRLSSCYFCGVAPDESLRDYPLAPGDGDPTAVVTLCPTCRRKLETVLSDVTSHTAEGSADPTVVTEAAAELGTGDRESIEPSTGADDEPLVTGARGTSGRDGGTEPLVAGDIETAADVTAAAESATDDGETDGSGPTDTGDAEEKTQQTSTSEVPETLQTGETSDEDANGDTSAGDDGTEPTLSALEYNKVMRLLQNREFPVDRTEIVDLAASAYELTEPECEDVIDLAVDRGLVGQEAGTLVRPDD